MKTISYIILFFLTALTFGSELFAQKGSDSTRVVQFGFKDKDRDGINDRFHDADGDGVNDVNRKPYAHRFEFIDKNHDSVNDQWIDRDGDGVNDISSKLSVELQAPEHHILDVDKDGCNDITGERYKKTKYFGNKFGFIDERTGKIQGKFLDRDGNGIDDRLERSPDGRQKVSDVFIDEDGDGICDGRGDALKRQRRRGSDRKGRRN